jgi:Rha family phage regulatory protein
MNLVDVKIEKNQDYGLVVSSRVIANELGKRHSDVLESLDKILENGNFRSLCIPSTYRVDGQQREYKEYLLTKDGFTLYMFNIQGYNDFKMAYINKFNEMERALLKPALPQTYKEALLELVSKIEENEKLQESLEKSEALVAHKTDVISYLTDDIKLMTQRQFLNEIIRMKGNENNLIRERWKTLYDFYEKKNHINLSARFEAYNKTHSPKLKSKLQLIDEVLNDIPTLYKLAVKTFEADFKDKLQKYLDVI